MNSQATRTLLLLLAVTLTSAQRCEDEPRLRPSELASLAGTEWNGTLTYVDYGSGKRIAIPSRLRITQPSGDASALLFAYSYPDEPNANQSSTIAISADGRMIDDERIVEKAVDGDVLRIVTERSGTDNDKPALIRYTYSIAAGRLSIAKHVRFEGSDAFIERNQYAWVRVAGN
jgi:hypothetical protein